MVHYLLFLSKKRLSCRKYLLIKIVRIQFMYFCKSVHVLHSKNTFQSCVYQKKRIVLYYVRKCHKNVLPVTTSQIQKFGIRSMQKSNLPKKAK